MSLNINIERALERAKEVQPAETEIISLINLPDGQWTCHYMTDEPQVVQHKRTCYKMLEMPLFDLNEL